MTKYIDLLREHQSSGDKKGAAHNGKNSAKDIKPTSFNPYSQSKENNENFIQDTDVLLEEELQAENLSATEDEFSSEALLDEEADTVGFASNDTNSRDSNPRDLNATDSSQESSNQTYSNQRGSRSSLNKDAEIAQADSSSDAKHSPPINTLINTNGFDVALWLKGLSQQLLSFFAAVQNNDKASIEPITEQLHVFFDKIETSPEVINALELEINANIKANILKDDNSDLAQKSALLMLYTIKVAMQLKLTAQEVLPFTVAVMLHHLGMAMVPNKIRHKVEALTDSEFKQIRDASKRGLDYLQTHDIKHEQLSLAISQGSERFDGSGPKGMLESKIAWVARLVSLLSMFEALIHFRPYRQRLLPRDAIREIVKNHKKTFDPEMLKALIDSISLYPVGTFIQLNTGEIGQVVNVHVKFPLRPVVYINMDKYGHTINARQVDLKKQPNLMIQKCMYEETLKEITAEQSAL